MPWQREVRGQRRVAGDTRERPTAGREGVHRTFDVVRGLRPVGVGEPLRELFLVRLGQLGRVDVGAAAVRRGERQPDEDAGAAAPRAGERQPGAAATGGVLDQPARDLIRPEQATLHLEPLLGFGLRSGQRLVKPVPQDAELQGVEDLMHLLAVP